MEIIYHHFDSLPSTNDWAKAHLTSFDLTKITVVTADSQTAGRGQYSRRWISPPKLNLYVTFSFFVTELLESYTLTHLLAFSVANTLSMIPCRIKWPNDLLVRDKKIAGILCEIVPQSSLHGVILGLGFNVNMPKEILDTIEQPATSLLQETDTLYDRSQLLELLTNNFATDLELFLKEGLSPFEEKLHKLFLPKK